MALDGKSVFGVGRGFHRHHLLSRRCDDRGRFHRRFNRFFVFLLEFTCHRRGTVVDLCRFRFHLRHFLVGEQEIGNIFLVEHQVELRAGEEGVACDMDADVVFMLQLEQAIAFFVQEVIGRLEGDSRFRRQQVALYRRGLDFP